MKLTQCVCFELAHKCPWAAKHPFCPASRPERWEGLDTTEPLSDAAIVDIATQLWCVHGFRGMFSWHFYNEPLASSERMGRLMSTIHQRVPEARFLLWTNGELVPHDCRAFGAFERVHYSVYPDQEPAGVLDRMRRLSQQSDRDVIVHFPADDGRCAERPRSNMPRCLRPFCEMIFDFFGNLHLCCQDWAGKASPGNVRLLGLAETVTRWQAARRSLLDMEAAPPFCEACGTHYEAVNQFDPHLANVAAYMVERYTAIGPRARLETPQLPWFDLLGA